MSKDLSIKQQIVISGVGGQGVLFITGLLAHAAIEKGLPVLTSETHGMAQRGGTVVSHLKVGEFSSPLIRPGRADGLLALKAENVAQYGSYLRPDAWVVVNSAEEIKPEGSRLAFCVDADDLSQQINNPRALNLLVLGFALGRMSALTAEQKKMFCTLDEIKTVLAEKLPANKALLDASIKVLETGCAKACNE
jgi:indolepyruvate ferredoxin oxidoreductase beta subunit